MKSLYFCIYIFCYISRRGILGISLTNYYHGGLIKYLKEESKLHQVVFILNNQQKDIDPIIDSLVTTVNSHFPSLSISYNTIRSELTELHSKLLNRPRSTTLFVLQWMNGSTVDQLNQFFDRKNDLLVGSSKPRFLILNSFLSTHEDINRILHSFWRNKYLDVTFLTYNYEFQKKIESTSEKLLQLSQINPFTDKNVTHAVSSETEWFPNKVLDLNGYKLEYDLESDETLSENVKSMKFLQILSQVMNFKPYTNKRKHKMETSDLSVFVERTKVDPELYLNMESMYTNYYQSMRNLRILKLDSAKAVLPQSVKVNKDVILSSELWYMILITIITIAIIRLLALLLKFKKISWQTLGLFQIVIGMSITREPKMMTERIVFGSVVIGCIIYTSYFFSVILDITFQSPPEITSLDELFKSSLTPKMNYGLRMALKENSLSDIRQWTEKAIEISHKGEEDCLKYLTDYENTTCVLNNAKYHVSKYEAKYGKINVTILQEPLGLSVCIFLSKSFSPFIDRFNEIILKASEFGLLKDFYGNVERLQSSSKELEIITMKKLFPILSSVLVIGYSLSTITFLLEILTAKAKGRFFKHVEI